MSLNRYGETTSAELRSYLGLYRGNGTGFPSERAARHYFAQRLPRLSGRDKSGPYDLCNELLLWRFIARSVGAQFHCARFGQDETVQKSDVHSF